MPQRPLTYRLARAFEELVGLTLIVSAALKGYELSLFIMQISGYRLIPPGTEGAVALLIVLAELFLGTALMTGYGRLALPHVFTISLLAAFSGIFVYGLLKRGIDECGCFGDFLQLPPPVTLGKNAVLVAILLAAIVLRRRSRWRAAPTRRAIVISAVLALISLGALAAGARIQIVEEREKQTMASGPIDPARPFARFKFALDGRDYDMGSGQYLIVWLSTTCRECKEAIAPVGELMQFIPDHPPLVGFSLGNKATLRDFRDETKPSFPTILVPSRLFMDYVDVDPPRYTLVRDGRVVGQWDGNLPAPIELAEKIGGL